MEEIKMWLDRASSQRFEKVSNRLHKCKNPSIVCACLARFVDREQQAYAPLGSFTEAFVFGSFMSGVVVLTWMGLAGFYYYIVPCIIACFILYVVSSPLSYNPCLHEEIEVMGGMLSDSADSVLHFYTLVSLRNTTPDLMTRVQEYHIGDYHKHPQGRAALSHDLSPEGYVVRQVLASALYKLSTYHLYSMCTTPRMQVFRRMFHEYQLEGEVLHMLERDDVSAHLVRRFQRVTLVMAIVAQEKYPATWRSFKIRKWGRRVSSALLDLSITGMCLIQDQGWISQRWVPRLAGQNIREGVDIVFHDKL
jgi:hypothetical protein